MFSGQDLAQSGDDSHEYEYFITVPPERFDQLRQALGVGREADVLEAVCDRVDDIMPRGEATWLTEHGIEYEFASW